MRQSPVPGFAFSAAIGLAVAFRAAVGSSEVAAAVFGEAAECGVHGTTTANPTMATARVRNRKRMIPPPAK
jgi:hypothetical protein